MEEQKNRDSDESKPEQNIGKIIRSDQPGDPNKHKEKRKGGTNTGDNRFSSWTRPEIMMVVLTAIIAIATIINIYVFWLESESTSKQTIRLIEEAGKIADSMKDTVGQAQATLDASREAVSLDQRAWVGLVGVETVGGEQTSDAFSFKSIIVAIRNSGKTPALKMSGECCMYVNRPWTEPIPDYDSETKRIEEERRKLDDERRKQNEEEIKRHPEFADRIREFEKSYSQVSEHKIPAGGVLAPSIVHNISVAPSMKFGTARKPGEPPKTLYVLGRFTYTDIFTGAQRHSTKFCLMHTEGDSFSICPESNWMD